MKSKKIAALAIAASALVVIALVHLKAAVRATDNGIIGPAAVDGQVTISAAGTGLRNCLTSLSANSTSYATLRVLDGGTTIYAILLSSQSAWGDRWMTDYPLCGSFNTAMTIRLSSGSVTGNLISGSINYGGYVRQK